MCSWNSLNKILREGFFSFLSFIAEKFEEKTAGSAKVRLQIIGFVPNCILPYLKVCGAVSLQTISHGYIRFKTMHSIWT